MPFWSLQIPKPLHNMGKKKKKLSDNHTTYNRKTYTETMLMLVFYYWKKKVPCKYTKCNTILRTATGNLLTYLSSVSPSQQGKQNQSGLASVMLWIFLTFLSAQQTIKTHPYAWSFIFFICITNQHWPTPVYLLGEKTVGTVYLFSTH